MDPDEPRKPRKQIPTPTPTTDGEQTASHSYSTRSKVKRTSHCDDESSGSNGQQPPLKRHTRTGPGPGAKEAGNSARIENNDPTQESNAIVVTNAVDEFATANIALQNDLVLETLFKYMNRSDLLSCRAVNKQWQPECTKELRRRKLVIRFSFHSQGNQQNSGSIASRDICRRLSECRTPSLLASFQVKIDARHDLGSTGVTSFFPTVGHQLRNLTLHLNYSKKRSSFEITSLQTDLQNLLFRQAPNLEFLDINFDFPPHWEAMLETLDVLDLGLGLNQNDHSEPELLLLPNLKTFLISGSPAPKFFADVIKAGVNLRSFGGAWSACRTYLMGAEGRVKIHLLKSLSFQLLVYSQNRVNELDHKLMKTFLTDHQENLKLEAFECVSGYISKDWSWYHRMRGNGVFTVFNQILECSSGSLLKLIIEEENWFIIPRLPQLKEIGLDCFRRSLNYRQDHYFDEFFPQGFNMNHTFPNVSSIVLLRCAADLFRQFVNRIGIELTEPVPSIRYITVMIDTGKIGNIVPSLPTVTDFRHVFPNLVSISYVENEKYYKI